ncbi:MFS transporter [Brachybacterium sp. DNPG3]
MAAQSAPTTDGATGGATATGGPPASRLITPTFAIAWGANFFQYLTFYFLVTTMALYAVREFAASDAAGGFASSAFVVGATVARLLSGYMVDRFGSRRVMVVALVVATLMCALYLPAGSLALLIAVRIVHGFSYAFASTAIMAIVQRGIPAARRAEGTGYLALGTTLAAALGPALGLAIVGSFSYAILFWTALATAVVGLLLGLFIREDASRASRPTGAAAAARPAFAVRSILHPRVVPIGLFMVLVGLSYAGVITFLNAYSEERDLVAGASFFFVAYAISMFCMRFVLGRAQDARGDNLVVYFGLLMFVAALVLLAVAGEDWQVVVAGVLTGLGYGTLMPAAQAIAVSAVDEHELGTGISTLLLLADLGIGLGPVLLGVVVTVAGYGAMFGGLAVVIVLAAILYHGVHGRHEGDRRLARAAALNASDADELTAVA